MRDVQSLTWDTTAPAGFTNAGMFTLNAEFWDNDPFAGGNFVSFALNQSAAYSASVTQPVVVPEPATLLLLLTGVAALGAGRRRLIP